MQGKIGDSVIVCGYVPKDADFKYVGDNSTELCKFSVKIGEKEIAGQQQKQAVWCNCTCWRGVATAASGIEKGDTVLAIGKLETRSYQTSTGDDRTSTDLVCEAVFTMSKGFQTIRPPIAAPEPKFAPAESTFTDVEDISDDELPF